MKLLLCVFSCLYSSVKPQPKDCNISMQHMVQCVTLSGATCCPRLSTVVRFCTMLGVVASNVKMIKFFMQHLWMLWCCKINTHKHTCCSRLARFVQRCCTGLEHLFNFQYPTCHNRVAKCMQNVVLNSVTIYLHWNVAMIWPELANVGPKICCDHLAGA